MSMNTLLRSVECIRGKTPFGNILNEIQRRAYFKANDGILPRRESRRTLARTRRDISSPFPHGSKTVLIPPFVSPGELRILLGVDYKSALSLCKVKMYQQKYYWSDAEGRLFETSNKRKVLVPFELVAPSIKLFGLNPVLVDPEPVVEWEGEKGRVPVVAVLGMSSSVCPEYGETISTGITDSGKNLSDFFFDISKVTLLGLGSCCSRSMLGRTVTHADLVISSLDYPELEAVRNFNPNQMQEKLVAIPLCGMEQLKETIAEFFIKLNTKRSLNHYSVGGSGGSASAIEYRSEKKRTDVLVEAEKGPSASGVILDVTKTAQEGTTALLLVKSGRIRLGQNFVAGSGFGKVTNILNVRNEPLAEAVPGTVVRVGKIIKNEEYTGDFAPDDNLLVLPRERAWRLAFHRQRIEWLNSFQTEGKRLQVDSFQLDSALSNSRHHLDVSPSFSSSRPLVTKKIEIEMVDANASILIEPENSSGFTARAAKESEKVITRWQRREEARIQAKLEQATNTEKERLQLHNIRHLLYTGKPAPQSSSPASSLLKPPSNDTVDLLPLPTSLPVIPIIVKTGSVSDFDSVLDELELLQLEFNVKLPVVHGGIGPVTQNDIVHADIESKTSLCPIYMLNTSSLPHCTLNTAQLVNLSSVSELIADVRLRIRKVAAQKSRAANRNALTQMLYRNKK